LEYKLQEKNVHIKGLEDALRGEQAYRSQHIGMEKVQELIHIARAEKTEKLEIANRAMTLCRVLRSVLQECKESYHLRPQQTTSPEASFQVIQAKDMKMLTTIDEAMKSLSSVSALSSEGETATASTGSSNKNKISPTTPLRMMRDDHDHLMSITDSPLPGKANHRGDGSLQPINRQIRSLRKNTPVVDSHDNEEMISQMKTKANTNTRRALWPEVVVGGVKPLQKRRFSAFAAKIRGTVMKLLFFSAIFLLGKRNYAINQLQQQPRKPTRETL
jgi:hypothetical protein